MRKRATAQEVAERAGVSKWTVIRAFTEGASISDDKKRKVLAAAEKLNYTPNLLARSLATNLTHQVAVFVDDFGNPEKLPYLEALTDKLQEAGLVAVLININTHFDHVRALLNAGQRQVDAVILLGTAFRDETLNDRTRRRGMPPMYVLARDSQIEGVPAVFCDGEIALREIVEYLSSRGYRKPGFMSGAHVPATALRREQYYSEFWQAKGISDVKGIEAARYSADEGARTIRSYLHATPDSERIDVLMCENDILALGALDVIRGEFGLKVPEDIAVVGFDNFKLGNNSAFGLTTYEQPLHQMVDAIVDMVKGDRKPENIAFPGQLIVRKSA